MSDPIAEAAAHIADAAPSSTEPMGNTDTGASGSSVPVVYSSVPLTSSDANAGSSGSQAIGPEVGEQAPIGNVLLNGAPVVDAPVIAAPAVEADPEPLPRESHLMLLEAKFAAALAKLRNAERVSVDELESIYTHIQAVI